MSLPHDEQPLTRRQLREMERQKPRKEREADARASEEAEAARKAQAEREAQESAARDQVEQEQAAPQQAAAQAPEAAQPVAQEPDSSTVAMPVAAQADDEPVEPEIVSSPDDSVDDSEPSDRGEPVIDVVAISEPIVVEPLSADESARERDAVVEEMVIDVPIAATVDPAQEAAAHLDGVADDDQLAPRFQGGTAARPAPAPDQPAFDDLISARNAAAANSISTTSALVLPAVPGSSDVGTALDETGEVIITGSIDLPPSFGSMGAPASGIEAHDLDSLIDRAEADQQRSDVAPVSAARAISTNTGATSLITPPKRARANAPVVLAVTAAVLAVGVIGLLLSVFVFKLF
ncbi:hypothetical protein ACFJGV_00825 [Cnuibacter sp. UC19_7]|uniref:hypothetical protein n=1 Tax=Cnuibacter sp. UC19_7 TaxID=3350166 RepID=UPI00366C1410